MKVPIRPEDKILVFVSYARADGRRAEFTKRMIDADLREIAEVWVDDESIAPGVQWRSELEANLRAARVILLLVTPGFLRSRHCLREAEIARRCQGTGAVVLLIPLAACNLEQEVFRGMFRMAKEGFLSVDNEEEMGGLAMLLKLTVYQCFEARHGKIRPSPGDGEPECPLVVMHAFGDGYGTRRAGIGWLLSGLVVGGGAGAAVGGFFPGGISDFFGMALFCVGAFLLAVLWKLTLRVLEMAFLDGIRIGLRAGWLMLTVCGTAGILQGLMYGVPSAIVLKLATNELNRAGMAIYAGLAVGLSALGWYLMTRPKRLGIYHRLRAAGAAPPGGWRIDTLARESDAARGLAGRE